MIDPEQISEVTLVHKEATVLSFDDIRYSVTVKKNPCSKATEKTIINGISGIFQPGLNAILGATGCGKTSLLDILAKRKDPAGLDGHVLINGRPMGSNFRLMSGYVPQDDLVLGTLTVRENIYYSANLRLPSTYTQEEKCKMVDDVIEELGLSHVAHSKVGNQVIRGISGGERKRTAIGIELVIAPRVLFLDEPTTGLDATTSSSVIALLHRLSRRGRTIIFSIHQPRYSIFKLFDRMMLLARGKVMYHGPANEALDYFSTIGFQCETHNNPADFFLDIINGDIAATDQNEIVFVNGKSEVRTSFSNPSFTTDNELVSRASKTDLKEASNGHSVPELHKQLSIISNTSHVIEETNKPSQQPDFNMEDLVKVNAKHFEDSPWFTQVRSDLDPITKNFNNNKDQYISDLSKKEHRVNYNVSPFTQFVYLSRRTFLNLWRNPLASFMQIVVILFFACFAGMIYFDLDPSLTTGLQNRAGAFFFLCMNQVFMNMTALEIFLSQRVMFMHENATGFYRVSVYFLCKLFLDVIPMRILPVIGFSTIVVFMMDFQFGAGGFFIFMLNLCLTSIAASSFCFMYSSIFDIYALCYMSCALSFILMMVSGGFIINLDDIWIGIRWLKHFSIFRYSINVMAILELEDIVLCETQTTANGTEIEFCSETAGRNYLETQQIDYETTWDLWKNLLGLFCLSLGALTITYIRLRTINKYK